MFLYSDLWGKAPHTLKTGFIHPWQCHKKRACIVLRIPSKWLLSILGPDISVWVRYRARHTNKNTWTFILTSLGLQVFKLKLWVVKLCLSNCLIFSKFILSYTVRRQNYTVTHLTNILFSIHCQKIGKMPNTSTHTCFLSRKHSKLEPATLWFVPENDLSDSFVYQNCCCFKFSVDRKSVIHCLGK